MLRKPTKITAAFVVLLLATGCAWFGYGEEENNQPRRSSNDPLVMEGELEKKDQTSDRQDRTNRQTQRNSTPTLERQPSDSKESSGSTSQQIEPELTRQTQPSARELAKEAKQAYENGNNEEAISKYRRAMKLDSSNPSYPFNLGSIHFSEQNYRKARDHYRRTINVQADHELAHLYLGASYLRLGNQRAAKQHFNRVLEINPNNDRARQFLDQLN